MGIGEAAERLGMRTSALRYYDERGLVRPALRVGGRRMYGPEELRRLAFLKIAQSLGIRLDAAAAVLDEPGRRWHRALREQAVELDQLIARAEAAKRFLSHALACPSENPARDCPDLTAALDRVVAGLPIEQLDPGRS